MKRAPARDKTNPAAPDTGTTAPAGNPKPPEWSADHALTMLRNVNDIDLGVNIVDLGLIYEIQVNGPQIAVYMTLTSPACPYGPYLIQQVKDTLLSLSGITEVKVKIVWDPPWNVTRISEDVRLELGFDV